MDAGVYERLEAMSDDEKKDLKAHAQVKAAVTEIKAAREVARAKKAKAEAKGTDDLDF